MKRHRNRLAACKGVRLLVTSIAGSTETILYYLQGETLRQYDTCGNERRTWDLQEMLQSSHIDAFSLRRAYDEMRDAHT